MAKKCAIGLCYLLNNLRWSDIDGSFSKWHILVSKWYIFQGANLLKKGVENDIIIVWNSRKEGGGYGQSGIYKTFFSR